MSDLSRLLRKSRLASLAAPLKKRSNKHPRHQVVETRSNALARQEWGIKYYLPKSVDSRYVTFSKLDSMERMVDFETNGSSHWKLLRFKETGIALEHSLPTPNPLFYGSSKSSEKFISLSALYNLNSSTPPYRVQQILDGVKGLRKEFQKWLLSKHPTLLNEKGLDAKDLSVEVLEFLGTVRAEVGKNSIAYLRNASGSKIKGTGGLSYNLKGRLANAPDGVVQKFVAPGRFVSNFGSQKSVAIGGFVCEVSSTGSQLQYNKSQADGKTPRESVIPFVVEKAVLQTDGSVKIKTSAVSKPLNNDLRSADYFYVKSKTRSASRQTNESFDTSSDKDGVKKLLDLLKN